MKKISNVSNKNSKQTKPEINPKANKKLKKFNVKGWVGAWSALAIIGIIVIAAPAINYGVNEQPVLQEAVRKSAQQQRNAFNFYTSISKENNTKVSINDNGSLPSRYNLPTGPISINEFRNLFGDSDNVLPAATATMLDHDNYRVVLSKGAADDASGTLQIHARLIHSEGNEAIAFNRDGTTSTDLNAGGIDFSLSGFTATTNLIKNYYDQVKQQLQYLANDTKKNTLPSSIALPDNASIADVNALLSSNTLLPAFSQTLATQNYALNFSLSNHDDANGKLTIKVIISKLGNPVVQYDANGEPSTINPGVDITASGYLTTQSQDQTAISSYYSSLKDVSPQSSQTNTLPSQIVSKLGNNPSLTDLNNILNSGDSQIPGLPTNNISGGFTTQFTISANDASGTITLHTVVNNGSNYYKQDGTAQTDPNGTGKDIIISGFLKTQARDQSTISNYYNSLKNVSAQASQANSLPSQVVNTLGANPTLQSINAILNNGDNQVRGLPTDNISSGFSLQFKLTPNDATGTITLHALVNNGASYYKQDGTPQSDPNGAGKDITISNFLNTLTRDQRVVVQYYNSLKNVSAQSSQANSLPSTVATNLNSNSNLNSINAILNNGDNQVPNLPTSGISSGFGLQFNATGNDAQGTITLHVTVTNNGNFYKTDGNSQNTASGAGKDITISGFANATTTIKNFYQLLNSNLTIGSSQKNKFADSTVLTTKAPLLNDINGVINSPLPTLSPALTNAGYSLTFSQGQANVYNGAITLNAIVTKGSDRYDNNGNVNASFAGTPLTISGFSSVTRLNAGNVMVPGGWGPYVDRTGPGSTRDIGILTDGQTTQFIWYGSILNNGGFLGANLNSQRMINRIIFYNGGPSNIDDSGSRSDLWRDYKVQTSTDNKTWTDVKGYTISGNNSNATLDNNGIIHSTAKGQVIINFPDNIKAQYVRIISTSNTNSWSRVSEFAIFSSPV